MPRNKVHKNQVNDLITDQEMAFARLVLSGTMTDRDAAQAAGLNPDTAAYTKAKPSVRAYMLEHHAAVEQKLIELEAEEIRERSIGREQVLRRLWELANISPEITRGSMTGQVKAISIIVAIEGLIPDRRARSAQNKTAPVVPYAPYQADWILAQQGKTRNPPPNPPVPEPQPEPATAPSPAADVPPPPAPAVEPSQFPWVNRIHPSEIVPLEAYPTAFANTRVPFSIPRNPFRRR